MKHALRLLLGWSLFAMDAAQALEFSGVMSAAWQYRDLSDNSPAKSTGRGAYTFQPELKLPLRDEQWRGSELAAKLGFSVDNGFADDPDGFSLLSWDADYEDDVSDINGRNRDYLLSGWYRLYRKAGSRRQYDLVAGVIDATDYLDLNLYASDELTQFLNQAFVNKTLGAIPSYDLGARLSLDFRRWQFQFLAMDVGDDLDDLFEDYRYYAVEFGLKIAPALGKGNYRLLLSTTSKSFEDVSGSGNKRVELISVSLDQQLGKSWGIFSRLGWQNRDTFTEHAVSYTLGAVLLSARWIPPGDEFAFAGAYLTDGTLETAETWVGEVYYRFQLADELALTLDLQYQNDRTRTGFGLGSGNEGLIWGVRGTVGF